MRVRFIGDIHEKYELYLQYANFSGYTIQIGDMGYNYDCLAYVNPSKNFFLAGNHENYGVLLKNPPPHYLGDFGVLKLDNQSLFFVRGGISINQKEKCVGVDWWEEEELTNEQCEDCLELYKKIKPSIVFTHTCPQQIVPDVATKDLFYIIMRYGIDPTNNRTERLLQKMFDYHQPRLWIFGHHHRRWQKTIKGCSFVCIDKFDYKDIQISKK